MKAVGNDKAAIRDSAQWADAVILAVPSGALDDAVKAAGDGLNGKPLIEATNALDSKMNLAVGFNTSGAEELQKKVPKARVAGWRAAHRVPARRRRGRQGRRPGRLRAQDGDGHQLQLMHK